MVREANVIVGAETTLEASTIRVASAGTPQQMKDFIAAVNPRGRAGANSSGSNGSAAARRPTKQIVSDLRKLTGFN